MGVEKIPWETKLAILQRYKETQGTAVVPTRYIDPDSGFRLGGWVHHLRQTKNKLTPEQVQILENMGFVWNASKERPWEIKLAALRRFYEQHNHFRVPRFHVDEVSGFKLGQWIPSLRRKDAALKPARRRDLEQIGFFAPESSTTTNSTPGGGGGSGGTDEDDTEQQHHDLGDNSQLELSPATNLEALYHSDASNPQWGDELGLSTLSPYATTGPSSSTTATSAPSTSALSAIPDSGPLSMPGDLLDPSTSSAFLPSSTETHNTTAATTTTSSTTTTTTIAPENCFSLKPPALPPRDTTYSRGNGGAGGGGGGVRATVAQGLASMRQPLEHLKAQPTTLNDGIVQVIEL
ncbi:hypothetical protein ACA910_014927 [Epithemia clementina (nom. ined.)]